MNTPIPPLDPHVAALLDAERVIDPVSPEAHERAFGAVMDRVGLATADAPRGRAKGEHHLAKTALRVVGPPVVTFVAGFAAGIAWHGSLARRLGPLPAEPSNPPSVVAPPPSAASLANDTPPLRPGLAPAQVPSDRLARNNNDSVRIPLSSLPTHPTGPAGSVAADTRDTLAAEQVLVDMARRAVSQDDGAAALTALERHRTRFPDGLLAEEREALMVKALALLGRPIEARAGAERFHARYPNSLLGPAVDRAVGSGGDGAQP